MVNLYDASILTGPPSLNAAVIMPDGRDGGTHSISATVGPLDLRQSNPSRISVNDLVTMEGADYQVVQLHHLMGSVQLSETGGRFGEAVALSLERIGDPTVRLRLLVPSDGSFSPYGGGHGTVEYFSLFSAESVASYAWADYVADDDFRIDVTCFTTGTLIDTDRGPRPVHLLRVGDLVRTRDHGMQPLRWLGGRQLSGADLGGNPRLHPIRIAAGALGPGLPARDLVVSPQHRILVRSAIAQRMTGSAEVLIAAVHLLGHPGIARVQAQEGVGYWHLMFDRHEIVFAEGAEAESLYLGPMALAAMTDDAIEELHALFPELVSAGRDREAQPTARPVMRGKPVQKLIERQVKNFKPLVMAA